MLCKTCFVINALYSLHVTLSFIYHYYCCLDLIVFPIISDDVGEKPNGACIAATAVVYPPSLRLTVLASNSVGLAIGSVGVITSKEASTGWGCIGRNFHYCPVFDLSQDTDLEEMHCEILFNSSDESYFVRDNKSNIGTFLNGDKLDVVSAEINSINDHSTDWLQVTVS